MSDFDLNRLLDEFTAVNDSDAALLLVLEYRDVLLSNEAIALLESREVRGASLPSRVPILRDFGRLYGADPAQFYFQLFANLQSRIAMRRLCLLLGDAELDLIEEEAMQATFQSGNGSEPIEQMTARLTDLREMRQQSTAQLQTLIAEDQLIQDEAEAVLPLLAKVDEWCAQEDWQASEHFLLVNEAELLTDEAAGILLARVAEKQDDDRLQQHMMVHKRAREIGAVAAYAELRASLGEDQVDLAQVENLLVRWMQAPNWPVSEALLTVHEELLVSEHGEMVLRLLLQHNTGNASLQEHLELLVACRRDGIAVAYVGKR